MLGVVVAMAVQLSPTLGQTAYSAASSQTSIVPFGGGFFSIDFTEAKLGLTFVRRHPFECTPKGCIPNELNFSAYTSFAARKGVQDLFSSFDFTPGIDVGGRFAYVARGRSGRYDAGFLGVTYTTHERRVIVFDPVAQTGMLGADQQRTFAAVIGYNHAFSDVTILGLAIEGRRELSTPGVEPAREYCTPGTGPGGIPISVCSDRYLAPLPDLWTGQVRMDLSVGLAALGRPDAAAQLGITTAASADFVQRAQASVNVAVGPSLHLSAYPGQPIVVLLLGLQDIFDANDLRAGDPNPPAYFADHFVVRLVLGVPFKSLVGDRAF